tara:strand:- start:3078 stop:4721 length:1644 start_codon:yes stop_codon:yes gene_type:complete
MATEEIVLNVKSDIKSVNKDAQDLNSTLEEQKKILTELQREEIQLEQTRAGMSDYEASISGVDKQLKHLKGSIKEQKFEVKQLTEEQKKNTNELKENEKAIKDGIGNFRVFGVSLNGIQNSIKKIIPSIKLMFGTIKAGILSTGIGALLIAFGSLATYFTSTKKGADQLKIAFTAIGATIDVLRDRLSKVGEALSLVFSGKFKEAGDLFKESVTGIVTEIKEEIKVMTELEKRTQSLRDAELAFSVQKAKTRQEIEKARLIAEDESKSAEERIENLKKALELEEQTTKQELKLAEERVKIQEQQMAVSENLVEDEKKLADLKVALIEKETASIKLRRRVVTEVNALEREIAAEEAARLKEKEDREEAARKKKEEADKKAAKEAEKLAKKQAKEVLDIAKATESAKENLIKQGFAVAGELAGENAALSKGVAVAQTVYSTQQAIMAALAATSVGDKLLPYPLRLANAIGAGIMGASAIKKILSTSPNGAGASVSTPTAATGTPAPQMLSGKFELGGTEEQQPVQAYVVTDSLTDNQNKLAYIRRRATI